MIKQFQHEFLTTSPGTVVGLKYDDKHERFKALTRYLDKDTGEVKEAFLDVDWEWVESNFGKDHASLIKRLNSKCKGKGVYTVQENDVKNPAALLSMVKKMNNHQGKKESPTLLRVALQKVWGVTYVPQKTVSTVCLSKATKRAWDKFRREKKIYDKEYMKLDRYEKDFHLKLQKPKEPELTEEDKTVVSLTDNYFQLWHGTPNKPIAGNKIDEEEMRNLFGEDVTHFVRHTTKGNGLYQLPAGSSRCTIVTKKHPLYQFLTG